ncbi:MAG: Wadjet anti-phage system protein JetD domain-containing protein [Peptococcales bacterium]
MDFGVQILNALLDKYEASRHYQDEAVINRKVKLSFKAKNMPLYWDTDQPHIKVAIHQAVQELVQQDIITINWLPFEKGNLLDNVALNLDKVEEAYLLAHRIPKKDTVEGFQKRLKELQDKISLPWIKAFLNSALRESEKNKGIPIFLPPEEEERELLLQALLGLDELAGQPILERVFSKKYLGNSKVFQKRLRKRLAAIAREFAYCEQELDDDDIMAELGIEKTTEELLVKGNIVFSYQGQTLDYGVFPFGGIIDIGFARQMEISKIEASVILTIENKSNFHYLASRQLPAKILLIYIGGFPGPRKRELLARIYSYTLEEQIKLSFYHWGDIDMGGFRIFQVLKEIIPSLQPLFMDVNTVQEFREYCEETNKGYNFQLKELLFKDAYQEFYPVITYLLENKIRLEQEALLISDKLVDDLLNKL